MQTFVLPEKKANYAPPNLRKTDMRGKGSGKQN